MFAFTAALTAIALRQAAQADLLPTPGQNTPTCSWQPFDAKPVTAKQGPQTYTLPGGPSAEEGSIVGITIKHPPTLHHLKFQISVRASASNQTFGVASVGLNAKRPLGENWTTWWDKVTPISQTKWTVFEQDLPLPEDTTMLRIVIRNPNKQAIYLGTPHLIPGNPAQPDNNALALAKQNMEDYKKDRDHPAPTIAQKNADTAAAQPGLVVNHLLLRAPVRTQKPDQTGVVTFPVPARDVDQVPIAFKVTSDPPGKVLAYHWLKRPDGRNFVCQVTVKPGIKGAWIKTETLVLQRPPTPSANAKFNPKYAIWTKSTACVQSASPRIKEIEQRLADKTDTPESYARKVFAFVRDNAGKGAPFKQLDALAALDCGGSCTNRANLSAALLRAHGIPARTVSHMPTWSTDPLYEHWLTEYWQPNQGWVALDPSLGRWAPDRRTRIVLSTANPSDENLAFDPLHERFVMPGAPYLSVAELSQTLYAADLADTDAINLATQITRIHTKQEAKLFAQAENNFPTLFATLKKGAYTPSQYTKTLAPFSKP